MNSLICSDHIDISRVSASSNGEPTGIYFGNTEGKYYKFTSYNRVYTTANASKIYYPTIIIDDYIHRDSYTWMLITAAYINTVARNFVSTLIPNLHNLHKTGPKYDTVNFNINSLLAGVNWTAASIQYVEELTSVDGNPITDTVLFTSNGVSNSPPTHDVILEMIVF